MSKNKKYKEYQDILKETSLNFKEKEKKTKKKECIKVETKKKIKKEQEKKNIIDTSDIHEINVKKELKEKSSFGFGIILNDLKMGYKWKALIIVISGILYCYTYEYSFYFYFIFYNQQSKLSPDEFDNSFFF